MASTFNLSALPPEATNEMAAFLGALRNESPPPTNSSLSAVTLAITAAVLPTIVAAASAAPVAASAPLANGNARRITFTPTINRAHPMDPEPLSFIEIDFPDLETARKHIKALYRAHIRLISSSKAQAIFDNSIPSQSTTNASSQKKYINSILGNRHIDPVAFVFKVQGVVLSPTHCDYTADFPSPAEAYAYTVRLAKAHKSLLERTTHRNAAEQNAVDSLAPAQVSQDDVAPATASASAPAQNSHKAEEFDEKESDYSRQQNAFEKGETIIEKWLKGHREPPAIPNGFDPQTYDTGTHMLRITTILRSDPTTASESPSSPLSPASTTPPRSPSPAQNGSATASKVVTNLVEVEAGCLLITQEWPAKEGDPDYPDMPKGYELRTVTDDRVGDTCIRTLLLQEITLPAPSVAKSD